MRPKSSLRLSLYAGLSSLGVMLLYQAIEAFLTLPTVEKKRKAETIAVVSFLMLLVIEPLLSRIADSPHEVAFSKRGLLIRFLSLVVIVLVPLCDGLLHEFIGESVSPRGLSGIALLASSLIAPSVITSSWLQGLKKKPPRAARYGLYAAIAIGVAYSLLFLGYLIHKTAPSPQAWSDYFTLVEIGTIVAAVFLWPIALAFVASGFLGGLAADRGRCRHAWQRIAIGLAVAAAVYSVSSVFVVVFAFGIAKTKLTVWSLLLPSAIGNIGWALGFVLVPDSDNLFEIERAKSEEKSVGEESAGFAYYAVLTAVCIMAIAIGCLKIASFLSWGMVNRALHPASTIRPLPQARSTLPPASRADVSIMNQVKSEQIPRAARGTSGNLENEFGREQNRYRAGLTNRRGNSENGAVRQGRLCFCLFEPISALLSIESDTQCRPID
jgi:hypothetical protein